MRRAFIILLLILAAASSLAYLVRIDPGYVLVELHGIAVETTVWVAFLAGFVLLIIFYYCGRVLVITADTLLRIVRPGRRRSGMLVRWGARRRRPTVRGVIAFFEGRWRDAARQLSRGARRADAPLLNYLLAARASHALGDAARAETLLQLASEIPDATHAVALVRAGVALDRNEPAAAVSILDEAGLDSRGRPAGMVLLLDALQRTGDWARVRALLPEARRQRVRAAPQLDAIEERAFNAALDDPAATAEALEAAWSALAPSLRERPALVARHALALARTGRVDDAERRLARALKEGWDERLIRVYGLVPASDARRQLALAESLLRDHDREPELLLALGRVALRNQLWGKARDYFESSLRLSPRPETCAELARLCEHLGEHEQSRALLARAVRSAVGELPALPMPGH